MKDSKLFNVFIHGKVCEIFVYTGAHAVSKSFHKFLRFLL